MRKDYYDPNSGYDPYYLPYFYSATGDRSKFSAVVQDLGGTGSGATAEIIWRNEGGANWWIDGFKITSAGSGYTNPRIVGRTVIYKLGGGSETIDFCYCNCEVVQGDGSVSLEVADSTGSGAVLVPTVTDGKITSVYVSSGGKNYSNPTILVVS